MFFSSIPPNLRKGEGGGELKTPQFPPLTMARVSYLGGMRLMCV